MPKSCCVTNCCVNKKKNPELSFYLIPSEATEPERRMLWIQAVRREDVNGKLWQPKSEYHYVCSKHFIGWFIKFLNLYFINSRFFMFITSRFKNCRC